MSSSSALMRPAMRRMKVVLPVPFAQQHEDLRVGELARLHVQREVALVFVISGYWSAKAGSPASRSSPSPPP